MPSKRLIAAVASAALLAAGPAIAQANASKTSRAAASLSPSNSLGSEGSDTVGWAMAGLVGAGVIYVLLSVLLDDDDDDDDDDFSPVSP